MRWLTLGLVLLTLAAGADPGTSGANPAASPPALQAAPSPSPEEQRPVIESSGENPARPVRRFDVRMNTSQKANDLWESLLTLRVDTIHSQGEGEWTIYTRFDFPSGFTAQPGSPTLMGTSDTLLQMFAATPEARVQGLIGLRMVVPTATRTNLGKGKWNIAPQVGVVVNIPEISPGTFMGVAAWNTSDFAGDGSRSRINQLTLKPLVHFELGDGWFVQTEPEIQHDNLTGRWFIPLDLMVGKMVSENVVMSLEYQRSLSGFQPNYFQFYEFRTGFFY